MSALPSVTFRHHGNVAYDAASLANKGAIHFSSTQPRKRKNSRKYRIDQNAISEREVYHSVDVKNPENA
jgi:hypothetical protein